MKIYLHELSDQETEFDFDEEESWVAKAVSQVDETGSRGPRPIETHISLRIIDGVVTAKGHVKTQLNLLCSRCANAFRLECSPRFSSLFCQDPDMAGVAHIERPEDGRGPARPMGQNKGFARHAHDFRSDASGDADSDLDITYLSQNFIDLSDLLSEQLQLQIPFQPLCREDCKGICASCGADQNIGRCACAKITKTSPFAVLQLQR